MEKRIDKLVATLSYNPLNPIDVPMLLVGTGNPKSKKDPLKVVNAITGDEAIELWNKLTKPRKDDSNGREGNARN